MWTVLLELDISSFKEKQKMPLKSFFRLLVGFGNTPGTHSELCALIDLQPTAQSADNKYDLSECDGDLEFWQRAFQFILFFL